MSKAQNRPLPLGRGGASTTEITADSSISKLVAVWLADLDLENKLAPSTRALYERNMRQLVMPAFEHYLLREITVRQVDQFIKTLAATKSCSMAKQARTVLSLAFGRRFASWSPRIRRG